MDHDLICTWLGLPAGSWPPDHYTLLGLPPGEADTAKIEEQVHDRLARLRSYQLHHPEQVTEAMNRLAQAFTCLTDPEAKRVYDRAFFPDVAPHHPPPTAAPPAGEEQITDPLAWLFGPWDQALASDAPTPAQILGEAMVSPAAPAGAPAEPAGGSDSAEGGAGGAVATDAPADAAPAAEAAAGEEQADPHYEAAHESPAARRGLGTKRALYRRIAVTRRLLRAWDALGPFVGRPSRRLTRIADAAELTRQLAEIRSLISSFPAIMGGAGQPGYFVIILARQQLIVPTFRALLPSQREELSRDWQAGRALLRSHHRFLRQQIEVFRRHGHFGRLVRAVRATLSDQPGYVLLGLGLAALLIALFFQIYGTRY